MSRRRPYVPPNRRQVRIVCTGRRTHPGRVLARITVDTLTGGWSIEVDRRAESGFRVSERHGVTRVFRCPSCPRAEPRAGSETLQRAVDSGEPVVDISLG